MYQASSSRPRCSPCPHAREVARGSTWAKQASADRSLPEARKGPGSLPTRSTARTASRDASRASSKRRSSPAARASATAARRRASARGRGRSAARPHASPSRSFSRWVPGAPLPSYAPPRLQSRDSPARARRGWRRRRTRRSEAAATRAPRSCARRLASSTAGRGGSSAPASEGAGRTPRWTPSTARRSPRSRRSTCSRCCAPADIAVVVASRGCGCA